MQTVPVADLAGCVGSTLGPSEWLTIDQDRISQFADATSDHQFIHIDPQAAARTPFGRTIAHGFLSLSMLSYFLGEIGVAPEGTVMAINYGSNKVRFLQPVKVDQRIRAVATVMDITEKKPGQYLFRKAITIEIDGEDTPALVAELLSLFIVQ
jgi:acyl dehydratase